MNGTKDQCVNNAKCEVNLNGEFGKEHAQCECEEGFVANADGECEYAFGSKCKMVNVTKIIKCDQVAPLYCRNGKCECEDELHKFDNQTRNSQMNVSSSLKSQTELTE